jgi:hypothetical protein
MSLRDRIDPIRIMSYFFMAAFIGVMVWIFIQELYP